MIRNLFPVAMALSGLAWLVLCPRGMGGICLAFFGVALLSYQPAEPDE